MSSAISADGSARDAHGKNQNGCGIVSADNAQGIQISWISTGVKRMVWEVYKITVTHYLQDGDDKMFEIEEPIICKHMFDRRYGGSGIVLNRIFDEAKAYALERAKHE